MTSFLEIQLRRHDQSEALTTLVRAWSDRDPIDAANDAAALHDLLTAKRALASRVVDDRSTSSHLAAAIGAWLERPAFDAQADAKALAKIMNDWAADALAEFIGPIAPAPQSHTTL